MSATATAVALEALSQVIDVHLAAKETTVNVIPLPLSPSGPPIVVPPHLADIVPPYPEWVDGRGVRAIDLSRWGMLVMGQLVAERLMEDADYRRIVDAAVQAVDAYPPQFLLRSELIGLGLAVLSEETP